MRLDEACERAFARHETFHPRYGWLKKAVEATQGPEDLFNRDDAVVQLGVGKNMVRSIRHWLLVAPSSQAPVWWIALNEFQAVEFDEAQLLAFVLDRVADFGEPNPSSVKKDVSLFLRMYCSGHALRATFEERIDAPFRGLGLLQPSTHEPTGYRFNIGPKPDLPPRVFAATVLDFVGRMHDRARTVNLSRALAEPGSPGRAFKLTDSAVLDLLSSACEESSHIKFGSSAGMPQLALDDDPGRVAYSLLAEHYAELGARLIWTPEVAVA